MLTYTYDITATDPTILVVSQMRLLLGDTDLTQVTTPPLSAVFADQEYLFFWNRNGAVSVTDLDLAICDALLALANDKARLAAFVQLQGGGSVDLRQVAGELRAQEKEIRERYYNNPSEAYAEQNWGDLSWRRLLWTQSLRATLTTTAPVGP